MKPATRVLVIGGGCAGVAAAHELLASGFQVTIAERNAGLGGVSTSVAYKDFLFDYGPHAYHIRNDAADGFFRSFYGPGELRVKKIKQQLILKHRYFSYPLKLHELIRQMNPLFTGRIGLDYVRAQVLCGLFPPRKRNFESWGVRNFGKTLYTLCFGNYTKKVWGIEPSLLSETLASQKLNRLNLKDIAKKLLGSEGEEQATYWTDFYYPEDGIGGFFSRVSAAIHAAGGAVLPNIRSFSLQWNGDSWQARLEQAQGGAVDGRFDFILSTVPLDTLACSIAGLGNGHTDAPLRYRGIVLINLILDRASAMDNHWIYLLDQPFICNRFTEQKNLGSKTAPRNKTALSFEICCNKGDSVWNMDDATLAGFARADLERVDPALAASVSDAFIFRESCAYPVYDLGFEEKVTGLINTLSAQPRLYSFGRLGLFVNTDMHDSFTMGMEAARAVSGDLPVPAWYGKMRPFLRF